VTIIYSLLVFPATRRRAEGRSMPCGSGTASKRTTSSFENGDLGTGDARSGYPIALDLEQGGFWRSKQRVKSRTGVVGKLLQSSLHPAAFRLLGKPRRFHRSDCPTRQGLATLRKRETFLFGSIKGPGTVRYEGKGLARQGGQAGDCSLGSLAVGRDLQRTGTSL